MANMHYRTLPRGGERISVIGLGTSGIHHSSDAEVERLVERAVEGGINFFDGVPSEWTPMAAYGRALAPVRQQVYLQVHFGAVYETGTEQKYGWTLDAGKIRRAVERTFDTLQTDYADFGFIHCIDEDADLDRYFEEGPWDYLLELQKQGVVRHLGASTHNPHIARRLVDTGRIDLMMFSINPAYDYSASSSDFSLGDVDERRSLYRACQQAGVGLSVMKAFGGGQLLDAKTSPFGRALTKNQLIQYALDQPGVLTVLPGVHNVADVEELLGFLDATPEERDYSVLGEFAPAKAIGTCVYCNHCLPCPAHIDVGAVNKYYDLARAGDTMAAEHYRQLSAHATDCLQCGHCEQRCPFHVKQETRMAEIASYFA